MAVPLLEGITSGQDIEVHGDGRLIQAFPSQKETHLLSYKSIKTANESPLLAECGRRANHRVC